VTCTPVTLVTLLAHCRNRLCDALGHPDPGRERRRRMSPTAKLLALAMLLGVATACTTSSGPRLPRERVMAIERGVTTMAQVREAFGTPASRNVAEDGAETWGYLHTRVERSLACAVPIVGWAFCRPVEYREDLSVGFDADGVVRALAFASSERFPGPRDRDRRVARQEPRFPSPPPDSIPIPNPIPGPYPPPLPARSPVSGPEAR
jgi:outer membrane protein assembly factor BamE (lipoprotein component of BamABCDE complex)